MNAVTLSQQQRAAIEQLLGDAKPATAGLLEQLAESIRDRREHQHPTWEDLFCLNLTSFMGERMGPVLRRLLDIEARVAELEEQQDRRRARLVALQNDALNMRGALSPNGEARKVPFALGETLTPAVEWLISRVTELEKVAVEARAALGSLCYDLEDPGTAALGALYLLQQATVGVPMEPGEAVPKVYRASHDSIVMGLYTTAAAARAHCEAEERRTWAKCEKPSFDWIEDEEDGVAELTVWVGGEECTTGYVVSTLELASEYDEEADE